MEIFNKNEKIRYAGFFVIGFLLNSTSLALEETYYKEKVFVSPKREVSIIASKEGYYPSTIVVYEGEEVQFYVTSSKQMPSCFILDQTKIFLPAKPGQISEARHTFNSKGTYKFYCPQGKIEGKLVVLEHPEMKRQRMMRRKLASDKKKVKIWRPRDE